MERHFGRWVRREIFLFSGYVFLDEELTPDTWQAVKACYGTLRILSRSQLSTTEEEYIRFLCNDGHALGMSRGYVAGGALVYLWLGSVLFRWAHRRYRQRTMPRTER